MEPIAHGFRHDPTEWIESAQTLQAAQVRTVLLRGPSPGDARLLQAEVEAILSRQNDDGGLGDNTPGHLIRLMRLGCSP